MKKYNFLAGYRCKFYLYMKNDFYYVFEEINLNSGMEINLF